MATEGTQLRSGGNIVAGANFYNPASALDGPNGSGQFLAVKLDTSADRTAVLADTGGEGIYGILQNTPESGSACDICMSGESKAVAGAAITRGAKLMTDTDGRLITATTGNLAVAEAVESAGAANDIILVRVYGAPHTI